MERGFCTFRPPRTRFIAVDEAIAPRAKDVVKSLTLQLEHGKLIGGARPLARTTTRDARGFLAPAVAKSAMLAHDRANLAKHDWPANDNSNPVLRSDHRPTSDHELEPRNPVLQGPLSPTSTYTQSGGPPIPLRPPGAWYVDPASAASLGHELALTRTRLRSLEARVATLRNSVSSVRDEIIDAAVSRANADMQKCRAADLSQLRDMHSDLSATVQEATAKTAGAVVEQLIGKLGAQVASKSDAPTCHCQTRREHRAVQQSRRLLRRAGTAPRTSR